MTYTIVAITLALVAGTIYAIWRSAEERKAEDRRFQERMKANFGPIQWPPPKGPKGFANDRRHRRAS